jgi:DNA-binding MarR family transcriptional regulator
MKRVAASVPYSQNYRYRNPQPQIIPMPEQSPQQGAIVHLNSIDIKTLVLNKAFDILNRIDSLPDIDIIEVRILQVLLVYPSKEFSEGYKKLGERCDRRTPVSPSTISSRIKSLEEKKYVYLEHPAHQKTYSIFLADKFWRLMSSLKQSLEKV